MTSPRAGEVTQLLQAWGDGDSLALEKLTPLVYTELRRAARRHMAREPSGHTLQATALVNEVYLRLVDFRLASWQNRAHFFAICAKLMRRILVDSARRRQHLRRGGGAPHVDLREALIVSPEPPAGLVALDDALQSLSAIDPRKGQVVELRYFGGLSVKESAEALKVSEDTVLRDWRLAKMWLLSEIGGEKRHEA
jgi:RNA polymerase sigma factor (TIGR02999 family)